MPNLSRSAMSAHALVLTLVCVCACGDERSSTDDNFADSGVDAGHTTDAALIDATTTLLDASSPPQGSVVQFVPDDQTTDVKLSNLGLSVYAYAGTQSRELVLSQLASALELVRLSSSEQVPSSVSFDAGAPLYATQVVLTPGNPLVDGWYALRLNPLPTQVRTLSTLLIDGLPASRFHVGSLPLLKRIELCDKEGAKTKLLVTFSEPVRSSKPAESAIRIASANAASCEPLVLPSSSQYAGFELLCTSLSGASSLQITFDGFASGAGIPLRTASGGSPDYTLEPASLTERGGCRVFYPSAAP